MYMLLVFVLLAILDVIVYMLGLPTISRVITDCSFYSPFMSLGFGILLGHRIKK